MIQYTYFDSSEEKKEAIDHVKVMMASTKDPNELRKLDKIMLCVIGTMVDGDEDGPTSVVLLSRN